MPKKPFKPPTGFTEYNPGRRTYPELNDALQEELARIPPSHDGDMVYKPCEVLLSDGAFIDRVYVADASSYIRHWGIWPEDDREKSSVDISKVTRIRESPTRLPIRFADELYKAGESAMGGCIFTVVFSDGASQVYVTGNAVDFIPYPVGKIAADIIRVYPHQGRDDSNKLLGCKYYWCLYGAGHLDSISWRSNV